MEFCTAIIKYQSECERNSAFERSLVEDFIKMIGIFAPHYGENSGRQSATNTLSLIRTGAYWTNRKPFPTSLNLPFRYAEKSRIK